jgi:phosphoglycerate dehydrogenase-like enzyme
MVDDHFLATMRRDAFLINVARGSLVDEASLLRALDDGAIAGAGLDVRRREPPHDDSTAAKLAHHPNVVSTPHVAGITVAAQERVVGMIGGDVARVLGGRPAQHAVGIHRRPTRPH